MDIFDSRYYILNKLYLSSIGHWSFQKMIPKRIAQFCITISILLAMVPLFRYMYSVRYDVEELMNCLVPCFCGMLSIAQICVYSLQSKKILELLIAMKKNWQIWTSGKELEILCSYAEIGRFYTILFTVNVYSAVFLVVSMSSAQPILDLIIPLNESRPKQFVWNVDFPYVEETNHYYWMLIYGAITGFYNLSILVCCESLLAVSLMHACGLFGILSYRLKRITELCYDKEYCNDKTISDLIFKELSSSIKIHNQALDFVRIMDSCYSPFLFNTIGINVLLLSFCGLQLLKSMDNLNKAIKFGGYTSGVFFHFFCLTLPSQKLLDCSSEIAVQAYDVCWYKIPVKSKKLLLLLIVRSQEPCKLTAGKFYTMDMETLSGLLQTSISFFTVMYSTL